jgi:hypothetical protein
MLISIIFSPSQLSIFHLIIIVASHFILSVIQNTLRQSINLISLIIVINVWFNNCFNDQFTQMILSFLNYYYLPLSFHEVFNYETQQMIG